MSCYCRFCQRSGLTEVTPSPATHDVVWNPPKLPTTRIIGRPRGQKIGDGYGVALQSETILFLDDYRRTVGWQRLKRQAGVHESTIRRALDGKRLQPLIAAHLEALKVALESLEEVDALGRVVG